MSSSENKSKSTENESILEVTGYDDKDKSFIVKSPMGNTLEISDTFAEMFPMWAGRVLITAENESWAIVAAQAATGFASSVIMSPAEAAIEGKTSQEETPDGRPGVIIQVYQRNRRALRDQMILRIGQCVLTCPTTAAFDNLREAPRRLKVGRSLRLFGDGFQRQGMVGDRKVWRIPVMEGEFRVEDSFGALEAVAGGNLLIMARSYVEGLKAAEAAVSRIKGNVEGVIMPFPGGICRAGSKVGSLKYKLKASTNHLYCPRLKRLTESLLPEDVNAVYEIVINGLKLEYVKKAMAEGIRAAAGVEGVVKVSAANYGGKLGPYRAELKELLR